MMGSPFLWKISTRYGAFVFPAHQKADGKLNDWPYLLRWEAFNDSRAAVEKALEEVTNDKYNVEDLTALRQRLYELTKAFHGSNEVRDWVRDNKGYGHFQTADRFLRRLDRKITTVESTGDLRPFRGQNVFDPETHCANVISLICFMNRNGVKFERPATGAEHVYYDLFAKMRALYLDVVESDSSIRPEDLTELAK